MWGTLRGETPVLLVGFVHCAACLAFSLSYLRCLELLPHSAAEFVASFAAQSRWAQAVLFPSGMLTAGVVGARIFREWSLGSRRGRFRLATVVFLFLMMLLELVVFEPGTQRVLRAGSGAAAIAEVGRLAPFFWLRLGMVAAVAATLIGASRAPLPARSGTGVHPRHRRVLFLVGAATFFQGYDSFIVVLALPQIGRDLGAGAGALGFALAAIRVGALLSIPFGRLADRHGRRRLLILSLVAYTAATAATALSRGLIDFAVLQLVAVIFLTTELSLAQVTVAEEFPASSRAFGQGLLGAFNGLGAGAAALLFPVVVGAGFGWRGMYCIGLVPLLLIAYLRRWLPESRRWEESSRRGVRAGRLADLARPPWRHRFAVLAVLSALVSAATAVSFSFASYRASGTLGWTAGEVSAMILGGGVFGFAGHFVLGPLADRFGRRGIGLLGQVGHAAAVLAFYRSDWLFPAFALMTIADAAILVSLNSLCTELFPTSVRATAKSCVTTTGVVGALLGLAAVGSFSAAAGGIGPVIGVIALLSAITAPGILLLPETRGETLDDLDAIELDDLAEATVGGA